MSTPASLSFKGQATKHTTVKRSIDSVSAVAIVIRLGSPIVLHLERREAFSFVKKNVGLAPFTLFNLLIRSQ